MSAIKLVSAALAATTLLGACSSSSGPSSTGRTVAFQMASQKGTPAPAGSALLSGQEVLTAGSDVIVVNSVQLVLRRIELERAVASPVCDSLNPGHDDCEELRAGPDLLDLPLGNGASRSFSVAVDTGSYKKIQLQIHKPSSSHDAAFIAANPGFDGVSIKMTGTYNGTQFSYVTDLDAEQEFEFNPPLAVTDASGASLTLFVDLAKWFDNGSVTAPGFIDPATALKGGPNEAQVKSAIESSLHAFEDEDHNGGDDHHGN
jgi:hypothetical protein